MVEGGARFDTVLMMMNGVGPTGTLEGLRRFLTTADRFPRARRGQLLVDSAAAVPAPADERPAERWPPAGGYPGQAWIDLEYEGTARPSVSRALRGRPTPSGPLAIDVGWNAEVAFEADGAYLCAADPSREPPTARAFDRLIDRFDSVLSTEPLAWPGGREGCRPGRGGGPASPGVPRAPAIEIGRSRDGPRPIHAYPRRRRAPFAWSLLGGCHADRARRSAAAGAVSCPYLPVPSRPAIRWSRASSGGIIPHIQP